MYPLQESWGDEAKRSALREAEIGGCISLANPHHGADSEAPEAMLIDAGFVASTNPIQSFEQCAKQRHSLRTGGRA